MPDVPDVPVVPVPAPGVSGPVPGRCGNVGPVPVVPVPLPTPEPLVPVPVPLPVPVVPMPAPPVAGAHGFVPTPFVVVVELLPVADPRWAPVVAELLPLPVAGELLPEPVVPTADEPEVDPLPLWAVVEVLVCPVVDPA